MDCQQAQNDLLSAESLTLLGPELAAHIAECPQCQTLLARLHRLEAETKALSVPAGHEQPSPEFLRTISTLAARSGPPVRHFVRRAIAAAVVLAFGLTAISLIFFNGSTVQADVLIGELVDWNLAIAHTHDAAGRTRLYQQQLQQLQKQVDQSHLAAADHDLAVALLNNAQWMTTEQNASEESQHFQSLADQLLARQQAASAAVAVHLQQIYQELINEGVSSGTGASNSPSTTEQHNGTSQTAPSSALPENQNLIPRALKAGTVAAVPGQSAGTASSVTTRDFSGWITDSENSSTLYPSRVSNVADAESSHAIGEHSHRIESHPADGDTLSTASQTSHTTGSPATVTTTVQPAHTLTDSLTHAPSSISLPPPSHPCTDGGPPPASANSPDGRVASIEHLSGLENSDGLLPPAYWQSAGDINVDDSIWPYHDSDRDGSGLMPPMAGIIPMSRHDIDTLLAYHITANWTGTSDLMLPYPPPPMDAESRSFFGLDGSGDRPTPFPEPTIGLAIPLAALAMRRRRRIVK
jgi:hypothetical protein